MTATTITGEQFAPRRVRVVGRPAADPRARTRTSAGTRTPYLRPVPRAGTDTVAEPAAPARPTRGGTNRGRLNTAPVAAEPRLAKRLRAAATAGVRVGNPLRYVGRVLYRDAVDGWIVQGRTLSIVEVARLQYAVPGDWKPFRLWCTFYTRSFGPFFAAVLDGTKWVFIHPVRGPLAGAGTAAAIIVPHFIH